MKKKKKTAPRKTLSTKNRTTKTLPKKYDKFPVNFQIVLSIHKLYCQNKNYIYKIKAQNFFFAKKKASSHARSACDEASLYLII